MSTDWPDLLAIRKKRKELGITQQELGKLSGAPQSIISRIEEGKIADPSYDTIKRIFEALLDFEHKHVDNQKGEDALVAKYLMNRELISVKPTDQMKEAWEIMKKNNFSQLPVIDEKGRIRGGITESSVLRLEGLEQEFQKKTVEDIMGDPFPIVGKDTRSKTLASILKSEQAVLVIDKGKIIGIITAYDLMENIYSRKPERVE